MTEEIQELNSTNLITPFVNILFLTNLKLKPACCKMKNSCVWCSDPFANEFSHKLEKKKPQGMDQTIFGALLFEGH